MRASEGATEVGSPAHDGVRSDAVQRRTALAARCARWDTTVIAASRAEQRCGVETPCRAPDVPGK